MRLRPPFRGISRDILIRPQDMRILLFLLSFIDFCLRRAYCLPSRAYAVPALRRRVIAFLRYRHRLTLYFSRASAITSTSSPVPAAADDSHYLLLIRLLLLSGSSLLPKYRLPSISLYIMPARFYQRLSAMMHAGLRHHQHHQRRIVLMLRFLSNFFHAGSTAFSTPRRRIAMPFIFYAANANCYHAATKTLLHDQHDGLFQKGVIGSAQITLRHHECQYFISARYSINIAVLPFPRHLL